MGRRTRRRLGKTRVNVRTVPSLIPPELVDRLEKRHQARLAELTPAARAEITRLEAEAEHAFLYGTRAEVDRMEAAVDRAFLHGPDAQ